MTIKKRICTVRMDNFGCINALLIDECSYNNEFSLKKDNKKMLKTS